MRPPEFMNVEFNPNDSDDDAVGDLPAHNPMNGGAAAFSDRPGSLRGDGYGGGGGLYHSLSKIPDIQSHNYEPDESEVWRAYVAQVHFSNRGQWWTTGKKRALNRWVLTFLVGVTQAIVAATCNFASRSLSKHKFDHVYALLNPTAVGEGSTTAADDDLLVQDENNASSGGFNQSAAGGGLGSAFLVFCCYQVFFAAIASIFVWIEPVSAGSGIPEIKCFLNGIDLPRIVRVKTLVCKVVGIAFSVAAGLPVGKEGKAISLMTWVIHAAVFPNPILLFYFRFNH